jgi:nucleotide-binding universal stress UspA family protein
VERIVVGISGGETAGRTLAWALREAATAGCDLTVVRADAPRRSAQRGAGPGGVKALELIDPALARAVVAARLTLGEQRVAVIVDPGPAGEVLLSVATPDDVVVIGPPTRPGWWARASTTYRVATRARCPVVIVHASAAQVAVDGIGRFLRSHVVVGVDGSPAANQALAFGFSYASDHQQPLAAVAVTHHTDSDVWFDDRMLETHLGGDLEPAVMLAREVEPWQHKFPGVQVRRAVVAAPPADGLRRCAQGAAVLVVGTSGIGPSPLGSVSRALLESAPCPVAIVRAAT